MTRLTIMFTILLLNVNVAFSQFMKTANTYSFDYKSKNIESIPDTAFMYPNTKYFNLDGNENLKLDSNFLIFSELEMISVSSCIGIDSLFPWDRFSKLANLDLSYLEYKKIPNSVYRIPNLTDLYIDGNYIKTISDSIFNLKNLEWLNLSENYGLNVRV